MSPNSAIVDYVKDKAKKTMEDIGDSVKDTAKVKTEEIIDIVEKKFMGSILYIVFLIMGSIFLILSGFYLLKENLELSTSASLLIIAVITFIIGYVIKSGNKNSKNRS